MTDQPSASIDDLLHHDEYDEPVARPARRRSAWGWLIRAVLIAAGLTAAITVGFRLIGVQVQVVPVFSGLLAVLVLRQVVARVAAPAPPTRPAGRPDPGADDGRYDWQGQDALRLAVRRWEARLDAVHSDPGRFSRTVLPVLAELTDERLRQRHGLTRTSDPRRARELLGEPLWRLLHETGRPPRRRDLAAHVETLEKL